MSLAGTKCGGVSGTDCCQNAGRRWDHAEFNFERKEDAGRSITREAAQKIVVPETDDGGK